jgi:hypothetical protein
MTYSQGGLIQATDFNTFYANTAQGGGANCLGNVWGVGSGNYGWGQNYLGNVAVGGQVTAPYWAALVANVTTAGQHTGATTTTRTPAPTAGATITAFSSFASDLGNINAARGNAVASGTAYGTFSGTTSKTAATSNGTQGSWTITFTHTVTFPSADQARYFFNAGGIVKVQYGKSGGSTDIDPDWNTFVGYCGNINITGGAQTIAGQAYTGTTRLNGSGGTPIVATGTGWYALVPGATAVNLFKLNNTNSPYAGEYIQTMGAVNSASTVLTLTTTWFQPAVSAAGTTTNISGGTNTPSPATTITGTAPTTLVTYIPPSTTYLSASWGTPGVSGPTIAASVA